MVGKRAHVEVVDGQVLGWDAELRGRLAHLAGERVRREALGQRPCRDRERDVPDIGAGLDEARHHAAAPELPVVGVRGEHQHALRRADHAGSPSRTATAASASSAQKSGSSMRAL